MTNGHGRTADCTGPVRDAKIVSDATTCRLDGLYGAGSVWQPRITASLFTLELVESTIAKIQGDTPAMNTTDDKIAIMEKALRDAKKSRKRARKADAKRKATVAESLRRRAVGLAALERIATQDSGDAAVAAARALAGGI